MMVYHHLGLGTQDTSQVPAAAAAPATATPAATTDAGDGGHSSSQVVPHMMDMVAVGGGDMATSMVLGCQVLHHGNYLKRALVNKKTRLKY